MCIVPFLNQIYITALVHWMSACVSSSYKKSSVRVDWKKCVYRSLQIMINLLAASIHQACRMVWIIIIICILYLCTFTKFCPKPPEILILQNKSYVTTMLLIDIKTLWLSVIKYQNIHEQYTNPYITKVMSLCRHLWGKTHRLISQ